MPSAFALLRPLLHALDPETVHNIGITALKSGLYPACAKPADPMLGIDLLGLHFKTPLGLAAGFDKNAVAVNALLKQGFSFVEAGTVTPLAQPGNPKPRLFRLSEDEAVINRLGFNNGGLEPYVQHFSARDKSLGVAGANIGKNKDSTDAVSDYVKGLEAVYPHADYITVNISSPNTKGLRDLQNKEALDQLLAALKVQHAKSRQLSGKHVPLLLKVAPDLSMEEKEDIAQAVGHHALDGLIVSNTTISRPGLKSRHALEQGGLSGRPLMALSTQALKDFYRLTQGNIPLVGVGGVASAEDAYAKIRAGASLVQLYTAIVYQGFGAVRRIQQGLPALLRRDGFSRVGEAVGIEAKI